jgi:hypothetical protein
VVGDDEAPHGRHQRDDKQDGEDRQGDGHGCS